MASSSRRRLTGRRMSSLLFPVEPYVTVGDAVRGLKRPVPKNGRSQEDSHVDVTPEGDRSGYMVCRRLLLVRPVHLPEEQRRNCRKRTPQSFSAHLDRGPQTRSLRRDILPSTEDRYLTPRECMRIHGYPDSYVLKGRSRPVGRVRYLDQHRQVANSYASARWTPGGQCC